MLTLRHFTSIALSFALVFTSPAAQLFQFGQPNAAQNSDFSVSALAQSDNGKDKVSPNPEVYPEFYSKGGQKDNAELLPMTQEDKFGGEKSSVKASEAFVTPAPTPAATASNTPLIVPTGSKTEKLLVIPIQFTDVKFDSAHSQSYFAGIMGKLKDYYEKNSGYAANVKGMTIDCTLAPVVTSAHTMSYYGADGLYIGDDDKNVHIYEIAREAVKLLDPTFDFSKYDTDNDGVIDHLVIIHAGDGQEDTYDTNTIWSHRWCIGSYGTYSNNSDLYDDYLDGERVDGKYAYNYVCTPESGTLGVFAHEFGHDIGLPDLYDTDGSLNGYTYGAGDWDVMGTGSWNSMPGDAPGTSPANLSAWCKEMLGWVTPTAITADGTYTLTNTSANNQAFKLWTDGDVDGSEYFLAEYRRKNGYDAGLPGEGLLVWHIDKQQIGYTYINNTINADENRLGVSLEQADGANDLFNCSNTGDSGDPFPGSAGNENFTSILAGMSDSEYGELYSFVDINNIKVTGNTVTADYSVAKRGVKDTPVINMPVNNAIVGNQPTFSWEVVPKAPYYKLQIASDSSFTVNLKEIYISRYSEGLTYKGSTLTYTLPNNESLGFAQAYYWRIAGYNGYNTGEMNTWSEVRSFRTPDSWQGKADMPTSRSVLAAAEYNGRIYTFGGYMDGLIPCDVVEVYDPNTDTWTQKAKMPTPRAVEKAVVLNGKIYVIGPKSSDDDTLLVEEYDPDGDIWSVKTGIPYLGGWYTFAAEAVNGKIYAIVQEWATGNGYVYEYDPAADTWTEKSNHKGNAFCYITSAAIGNKIYVIGSQEAPIEEYDPQSDTWTKKQTIFATGYYKTVLVYNGKILFLYQGNGYGYYGSSYLYDAAQDVISSVIMNEADMTDMASAVAGGNIYLFGGYSTGVSTTNIVKEYAAPPQAPVNLSAAQTNNEIRLTWDAVPDVIGYYVLADGVEYFCDTNSFIHSNLKVNSLHTYRVAAVNAYKYSDWSNITEVSTDGAPTITIAATNLSEGHEDGATISVHLTNGEFKADGIYNKATVTLDPAALPIGVSEGDVVRKDAATLEIKLVGNSMFDYNGRIYVKLSIEKDEITTDSSKDTTAEVLFADSQLTFPAIKAEAVLDETFEEGSETGKHITVDIANGTFINTFDRTKLRLLGLPAGVSIGAVNRVDDNTIDITLAGNSTADYDIWQVVYVVIDPSQLQPAPSSNVFCYVVLPAVFEEQPAALQNVSFSFSGTNAGKLMGITTDMEYSLDGGHNFTAAAAANQLLSKTQLNSITTSNDIIVRLTANGRNPFGLPYIINIVEGYPILYVTGNDYDNTVSGMNNSMEYSTDCVNWTAYNGTLPDLSGNITLYIRRAAVSQCMASEYITLTFTAGSTPLPPPYPGGGIPTIPSVPVVTEPAVPQEITDSDILLSFADIQKLITGGTARDAEVTVNDSSSGISIALEAGAIKYLYENKKDLVLNYNGIKLHIPYDAINEASQLSSTDKTWVKISLQAAYLSEYDEGLRSAMLQADRNITILGNRTFNLSCKLITGSSTQSISTFSNDVSVEIALNQADLQNIDTDRLGAYYFNQSTRQWDYMGGTFNSASGCYSFTTRHFSVYSVALYLRSFTDITNHWAKSDIEKMVARHVINGVSKDNFNPEGTITRAQFVALLVRALGVTQGTEIDMPFTDVTKGKWFYPEIGLAVKAGIISKADGVLFRPDANITREEMAVLIGRVIVMKLKTASLTETQINEKLGLFKDESMISKAARSMAAVAVSYGILNGRPGPVFAPSATTKRAEAAVMMKRLLELIQQAG